MKLMLNALVPAAVLAVAGCSSVSSNYTGAITRPDRAQMIVCHGFNCYMKTTLHLSQSDDEQFARLMAPGQASAAAERQAIANAIAYFETRATKAIGVADGAKSSGLESGKRGQMDCIDESTNSRTLLLYLQKRGLLNHHKVLGNVSRGFFADGRYPHSTALVADTSGRKWAVDSWFEPAGGKPDIMPLDEWLRRGVMGVR